ncbi:uncharacterized protein [Cebidichthys violaceus]|uniref:uncharacterized protein n=1 Tax=Cebidichthys violaceus TaxID=271503 RepID=UPI0035CAE3C8
MSTSSPRTGPCPPPPCPRPLPEQDHVLLHHVHVLSQNRTMSSSTMSTSSPRTGPCPPPPCPRPLPEQDHVLLHHVHVLSQNRTMSSSTMSTSSPRTLCGCGAVVLLQSTTVSLVSFRSRSKSGNSSEKCLNSGRGPGRGQGPGSGQGPGRGQGLRVFIIRVSDPVLNHLLDKLLEHGVITDAEMQSARTKDRADKARDVMDTVRRKGPEACSVLITALCEVDPYLYTALNFS